MMNRFLLLATKEASVCKRSTPPGFKIFPKHLSVGELRNMIQYIYFCWIVRPSKCQNDNKNFILRYLGCFTSKNRLKKTVHSILGPKLATMSCSEILPQKNPCTEKVPI